MCDKGVRGASSQGPELACRGTLKPSLLFSGKAEMCGAHTVVRCWSTHNKCDTALGDLWIAFVTGVVGQDSYSRGSTSPLRGPGRRRRDDCWSDSDCECLLSDATRREGALPAVGLQVRNLILHATSTRVPDTVLCGAGGSVARTPWVSAKARDPMVEEPRGWIALGAAGCHSLREGMCCEERSSCDSQRAPSAKKVCDSHTHTDTTEHNTHSHSDSNTPRAQRSVARTVCCLSDCPTSCSAVSQVFDRHPPRPSSLGYVVQSRRDVLRRTQQL